MSLDPRVEKTRSSWILSSWFLRRSWTGIDQHPHISRKEHAFELGSWPSTLTLGSYWK